MCDHHLPLLEGEQRKAVPVTDGSVVRKRMIFSDFQTTIRGPTATKDQTWSGPPQANSVPAALVTCPHTTVYTYRAALMIMSGRLVKCDC